MSINDSELFHGTYDPVKAREYYLKNRQLKGRKKGSAKPAAVTRSASATLGGKRTPVTRKKKLSKTERRRAELRAQQAALQKRLERLREVLKKLVEDAKKNSSANPKDSKTKAASSSSKTKGDGKDSRDRKPLTAKQKADKAKKAKEEYEKERPNSLSSDVEILKEQVKDIQGKIKKALEEAEDRRKNAGQKTTKAGAKIKPSSGPRGR